MLLLLALLLAAGAAPGAGEERLLLVRAGRGILGDGREIAPAAVLVRGEWIEEVGEEIAAPEGALVVEAPDAVLAPGLVDAHAWLDLEPALGEPGRADTAALRAADAMDPSSKALARERASGVTAFLLAPSDRSVVGGRPALLLTDEKATPLRETLGMKVALAPPALAGGRFPASHWGALEILRPRARLFTARGEVPVLVRARSTTDLKAALALLEENPVMRAAVVGGDHAFELAEELAARKADVIWGPAPPDATPRTLAGPKVLHEAGVRLAFATDGSPGSLRRTAVLAHRAGLPRKAAIRALTADAAAILGEGERLGRLAKGFRADLVLFSGDPLDLCSRALHVFVGGREVPVTKEARR